MIPFSKSIAVLVASGILTACATAGKDISSTYVSPMQYSNYDCEQLRSESMRISGRVNQLTGRLDEAASNDKAIAGVGIILFWPALFALGGTKQQEAELSRLKKPITSGARSTLPSCRKRSAQPATPRATCCR